MARRKAVKGEVDSSPKPVVDRARKCVICDDEYTFRVMPFGKYEGKNVCDHCIKKAISEED